ncbi:MAG: hypothetical protein AAF318_03080 [Pseudomonadota bacterium]
MTLRVIAVLAASLALAGCNTSYNYFYDDVETTEKEPGGFNMFKTAMQHAGVAPKAKSKLAYRPRAPLAMPSSTQLPSPRNGTNAAEAAVNFPTDHADAERQRRTRLRELLSGEDGSGAVRTASARARLPAEALAKPPQGPTAGDVLRDREQTSARNGEERTGILRIRRAGAAVLADDGTAAPREYLIQPPTAYRTPAASAALPEEGDIENSEWAKKRAYRNAPTLNKQNKTPRAPQ